MKQFLLFAALFFSQILFSQDTYYKSSIITLKNDTIKGLVSNIFDAKSFSFKKKTGDKPTIYTPQLLRGVILDDNVFERKMVNVSYYKYEQLYLSDANRNIVKDTAKGRYVDTVFVQKIVQGKVGFYKLKSKGGFTYYFGEKDSVLKEIPPQYYIQSYINNESWTQSNQVGGRQVNFVNSGGVSSYNSYRRYDYLDTLAYLLNDKSFYTTKHDMALTERKMTRFISQYNKKNGVANGGILKTKIRRKIFTGISLGLIKLGYDEDITDINLTRSYAFKFYGLYPLSGISRNAFAKFGINYFTYRNDFDKKSIPSASFGLRYQMLLGIFRPYFEGSIGIASLNKNNRPINFGFPMILEIGALIPIKDNFITLSISQTPITIYKLNGYKLWSFNVGVMF